MDTKTRSKIFIFIFAALGIVMHVFLTHRYRLVENQSILQSKIEQAVNVDSLFRGIQVPFDHLDGSIYGRVTSGQSHQLVLDRIAAANSPGRIFDRIVVANRPATLNLRLVSDDVLIRGAVPVESIRQSVEKIIEAAGIGEVMNELTVDPHILDPAWPRGFPAFAGEFFTGADYGELEFSPGILRLKRLVDSAGEKNSILKKAQKIVSADVRIVDEMTIRELSPFHLSITGSDDSIAMEGQTANKDLGALIESSIGKKVGIKVKNNLKLVPYTMQPVWIDSLAPFISEGISLGVSRMDVTDREITLEGTVPDETTKDQILTMAVTTFGEDFSIDSQLKIAEPPVVPTAPVAASPTPVIEPVRRPSLKASVSPERVEVTGEFSSEESRQAFKDGITRQLPDVEITEAIRVSKEVHPAKWPKVIGEFIPEFAEKTRDAKITVEDMEVSLHGSTLDPATRDELLAKLAAKLSNELRLRDQLIARDTGIDADRFPTWRVFFNTGSSFLGKEAVAQINSATTQITEAKLPTVLIKGLADFRGDTEFNQALSEDRARAVYSALVAGGIAPSQLEFIGVGEKEADQRADRDRMKFDRRVEITVVKKNQ